jgi:hypothetical protein
MLQAHPDHGTVCRFGFVRGAIGDASGIAFTGLRTPPSSSLANLKRPCRTQPRMPGSQRAPFTRWQTLSISCGQDQEPISAATSLRILARVDISWQRLRRQAAAGGSAMARRDQPLAASAASGRALRDGLGAPIVVVHVPAPLPCRWPCLVTPLP